MPQNGIHAIVGVVSRKWMPNKEWLLLGVVLGNMFPDLDNVVVAYATLFKHMTTEQAAEIYHRTFTHSIFTIIVLVALFYLASAVTKNMTWRNFGQGFGAGILMHMLLDLVIWFNGVELFWPIRYELNFWGWFVVPAWLKIFLDTGEFLAFGLYCLYLGSLARQYKTDTDSLSLLSVFAYVELGLFVLFTVLFFVSTKGIYHTIFGALYLLSMFYAIGVTFRVRRTLEKV